VDNLKIRMIRPALVLGLPVALFVGGTLGCSSAPEARVPERTPLAAPLLAGAPIHHAGWGRRDASLGEMRDAFVRVEEDVVVVTTDRRRDYRGVPYDSYRSTTVTRERIVR